MRRPWWISAGLAWAGVVAVVALVTWWVIDSAGEEVLAEPAPDGLTPSATTTAPSDDRTPRDPRSTRTPRTTPPGGPSEDTPGAGPSTAPTVATTAPQTIVPPPPPSGDATSEAAPVSRSSTWQGEAGVVRVSCTGDDLRLDGASPADGYEIDTNTRHSGRELEVRFRSTDGDRETEVHATCVGGAPDFRVEND
ncbi:hypothetical protein [Nocardioides antri]|uniref:Septum formation initiator n=1 Tax=Nocardioides antri TaxID=2607659 RepID=A0A5B1M066_9ACTN|nr:hypothetical protein [Nocardioides antri]KAA1426076.1 hypothetical protein F0U47_17250 [Nocardioides antri]